MDSAEDFQRLTFFEQAREQAEQDLAVNPENVSALVRLGGALMETSHYRQGREAVVMMEQVISGSRKLERHRELTAAQLLYTSSAHLALLQLYCYSRPPSITNLKGLRTHVQRGRCSSSALILPSSTAQLT